MESALAAMWPFTAELFEERRGCARGRRPGVGPDPATLRPEWEGYIRRVLGDATLVMPESTWTPSGGREGLHTECFG